MERFFPSILINNATLLVISVSALLVACWGGLVGGTVGLRWLLRTSRSRVLGLAGDWLLRQSTRLAGLISILVLLTAIGLLSWSLLFDRDLQPWAERLSTEWSAKLLWPLGRTLLILALFSVALWYFGRLRRAFLPRIEGRLMSLASLEEHGAVLQRIFRELPDLLNLAITYALADFATDALSLPASPRWVLLTLWIIPLVASAARFSVMTSQLLLDVLAGLVDRFTLRTAARPYYEQVVRLLPLARRVLEAMVYIAAAMVVVQRFDTLELVAPYGPTAIELVAVFFFGRVFAELIAVLAFEVLTRWGIPEEAESSEAGIEQEVRFEEIRARRVTLATLVKSLSRFSIYVGMVMVMLVVIGVDPVPLLAGLGVAGFAVGLGSQKIIQDIISGFFMLMEDQMLVGDYVRVGDAEGVVEELLLRVTRIRDRFGRVHTLCNGDVGNVINYSRGWTLTVVEMNVAYESDLREVLQVMAAAGEQLHARLPDKVLAPSEVMGVEAMDESCLRLRTETRVRPGCHYEVKRELNKILFEAFVEARLEIPYPKAIEFDRVPEPVRGGRD